MKEEAFVGIHPTEETRTETWNGNINSAVQFLFREIESIKKSKYQSISYQEFLENPKTRPAFQAIFTFFFPKETFVCNAQNWQKVYEKIANNGYGKEFYTNEVQKEINDTNKFVDLVIRTQKINESNIKNIKSANSLLSYLQQSKTYSPAIKNIDDTIWQNANKTYLEEMFATVNSKNITLFANRTIDLFVSDEQKRKQIIPYFNKDNILQFSNKTIITLLESEEGKKILGYLKGKDYKTIDKSIWNTASRQHPKEFITILNKDNFTHILNEIYVDSFWSTISKNKNNKEKIVNIVRELTQSNPKKIMDIIYFTKSRAKGFLGIFIKEILDKDNFPILGMPAYATLCETKGKYLKPIWESAKNHIIKGKQEFWQTNAQKIFSQELPTEFSEILTVNFFKEAYHSFHANLFTQPHTIKIVEEILTKKTENQDFIKQLIKDKIVKKTRFNGLKIAQQ